MLRSELLCPTGWSDYELLDSGNFEKLERFGRYVIARPEPQAIWDRSMRAEEWDRLADARFRKDRRSDDRGEWILRSGLPEQSENWNFIYRQVRDRFPDAKVLNLFAYTGGASLAARAAGAEVTHVDSVKPVVGWARENMEASGLDGIRWIVDDALKFVRRELRRGHLYQGIILDPPAYGRGPDGEKWVLEEHLNEMLRTCGQLLDRNGFLVLNLYSMGLSALLARSAVRQLVGSCNDEQFGELYFTDSYGKSLPLGVYYRCVR